MQTPINHHYVHESYQKRFRSSESKLYVILREHRNVVKETTPARTCYEPNLNTLIYEANQFKEIEEFYKNVESIFSNLLILFDSFTKVEKGSADDFLKIEEAQYIFK
ncbi:DUF4238 domain-containing protein [Acinetobacter bereziniae]|uniref:DUF4238 domain-containing protein n=1 Tax=Acinetobacter bereziniae TaxID=106648 RepID=UPI001116D458|nr:DUF4238 domain-containing protein [Acinetobacter bereziniae]TNL51210.1 DUF4238 domain-containing protein [Acinetobacter bereziniae]TNL58454.1 DUF4238 domain-containing protein [Acinetobacter bereziniae]